MNRRDSNQKKGLGRLLFGITARTAMTASAVVLILSYMSMYVNPATAWFMNVFGIIFLLAFLMNLFLFFWAASRRSRAIVIPFLALVPALFLIGRYIQISNDNEPGSDDNIRIVSYNVGKFSQYKSNSGIESERQCSDSVFAFLKNTNADIICLQEIHSTQADRISGWLKTNMPGYNAEYYINIDRKGAYGNVTLSRYPAFRKGKFDFEHSANMALFTDYDIKGKKVRVYNCHFESYNISISSLLDAITEKDKTTAYETEKKIRSSITRRPEQVSIILNDIKNSPIESIVAGDFNDTPVSYTYNKLKMGRKDSFIEAGRGMGGTYSLLWPFIRIDYILYPPSYEAVSHKVTKCRFSDHYPVITELRNI